MKPNSPPRRNWSWAQWRWGMWLFIAVVVALAFSAKAWLRQQYLTQEMRVQQQANVQASAANRIIVQLQQLSRTRQSEEVTKSKMAAYGPLILKSEDTPYHGRTVKFNDAVSGYRFELRFLDGYLLGYGWGSTRHATVPDLPFSYLIGQIAPWASGISFTAWVIVLITLLNSWKYRKPFAEALIALALLFGATSQLSVGPAFIFRPEWRSSYFWSSIAMLGLGFVLLLLPRRVEAGKPNRCRECEYDLTGNASGRCPECGSPIPAAPYDAAEFAR